MGNLDLIVQMHNDVESTLLPVERPLLQQQLVRICDPLFKFPCTEHFIPTVREAMPDWQLCRD